MEFNDLTPEQQEKAQKITTAEELAAFAAEEGFELTDEQLDAVAGGDMCWTYDTSGHNK